MNNLIWNKRLGVISVSSGVVLVGLSILQFVWHPQSTGGLLPPPVLPTSETPPNQGRDLFNVGEASGYRLVISFPNNQINPYPHSVSSGQVRVVDSQNQLVKIDGAVAISTIARYEDWITTPAGFLADNQPPRLTNIPEVKSIVGGYVAGLEPVPLRFGPVDWSDSSEGVAVLVLREGVADFHFVNYGNLTGSEPIQVSGVEFKDPTTGKYTIMPPQVPRDGLNYPRELVGTTISSAQNIPIGKLANSIQPTLTPQLITTGDSYYTMTASVASVVRNPATKTLASFTITIKPTDLYPNGDNQDVLRRVELRLMPAYPNANPNTNPPLNTYAARFTKLQIGDQTWPLPDTTAGSEIDSPKTGELVRFNIGKTEAVVTVETNDEPTLLSTLGFYLKVTSGETTVGLRNTTTRIKTPAYESNASLFLPMVTNKSQAGLQLPLPYFWLIAFQLFMLCLGGWWTIILNKRLTKSAVTT